MLLGSVYQHDSLPIIRYFRYSHDGRADYFSYLHNSRANYICYSHAVLIEQCLGKEKMRTNIYNLYVILGYKFSLLC